MATEQPTEEKKRKVIRLRKYDIDDTHLLQTSRTKHKHLLDNLAAFTAFDADFDAAYAADWLACIEECENHPTDAVVDAELKIKTAAVVTASKTCFEKASDLRYYVKKAFPKDELMLREFGFTERRHASNRTTNLLIWINVMWKQIAPDYLTELTNAGMPGTLLPAMQAAENALAAAEIDQETFKRIMVRLLRQRIEKFNRLYGFFTGVHAAAQSALSGDKERRELFNLT